MVFIDERADRHVEVVVVWSLPIVHEQVLALVIANRRKYVIYSFGWRILSPIGPRDSRMLGVVDL
jgi:hypothetical protein